MDLKIKPHQLGTTMFAVDGDRFTKYTFDFSLPEEWRASRGRDEHDQRSYGKLLNRFGDFEFFTYSRALKDVMLEEINQLDELTIVDSKITEPLVFYTLMSRKQRISFDPFMLRATGEFGVDSLMDLFFTIPEEKLISICGKAKFIAIKDLLVDRGNELPLLTLKTLDWSGFMKNPSMDYDELVDSLNRVMEKSEELDELTFSEKLMQLEMTREELEFLNETDFNRDEIKWSFQDQCTSLNPSENAVAQDISNIVASNILAYLFVLEFLSVEETVALARVVRDNFKIALDPYCYEEYDLALNRSNIKTRLRLCRKYLEIEQSNAIEEIIAFGEGKNVEFKSTIRYDIHRKENHIDRERDILRTIVGFLNSEGGTLIVGVEDDGNVIGISLDKFENNDKALLHIENRVSNSIKPINSQNYHSRIQSINNKDVVVIDVKPSRDPVFLDFKGEEGFFIRSGPSTRKLSQAETLSYVRQKFN